MAEGLTRIQFRRSSLPENPTFDARSLAPPEPAQPETFKGAASRYLEALLSEPVNPSFGRATSDQSAEQLLTDLTAGNLDEIELTGNFVAEFTQKWRGVPIYGAALGVEMTSGKDVVNVSGFVASPLEIDPVATLSPADARAHVEKIAGSEGEKQQPSLYATAPQLFLRYDDINSEWTLVYAFDKVRIAEAPPRDENAEKAEEVEEVEETVNFYKIFVNAHTGEEVARIPLVLHAAVNASGVDADGTNHTFTASQTAPNKYVLEDPTRRIRTTSMNFSSLDCGPLAIPGEAVESDNSVFAHSSAVVAHANATRVYDFFRDVLRRNSIDGSGMWLNSSVDCLKWRRNRFGICVPPANPDSRIFENAAWWREAESASPYLKRGMMVYGQVLWADGNLHSFAESLDVVGHELAHGITDYTCNLEYRIESGALNESYSDIFGVAISNADRNNVADWDWRLGEELSRIFTPIRNMQHPTQHRQPDHMNNFIRLPAGERPSNDNDMGYVHYNSGIHNKAAFNLFTNGIFTWREVVQMFYLTLVTPGRLVATSNFHDSRVGMVASCESLFTGAGNLQERLTAVRQAFDAVGIV